MIKNTFKAVTDYVEAFKSAHTVHDQAVKHIKANYKEGSELFTSAMKTAQETLQTALKPMQDICKETVKKDFNEARTAVKKAVAVAPSPNLMSFLPLIQSGKMNDAELQILLDARKGNYMDQKMIHDAMDEHFTTVDAVLSGLDTVEQQISTFMQTYSGQGLEKMSYNNALILNGGIIEELDTLTDDFVNTYGVQASEG